MSIDDINVNENELAARLVPTLRDAAIPNGMSSREYGRELVDGCRRDLSIVLPLSDSELAFLDALLEEGRIEASLLTADVELIRRIETHPLLAWKALNVRRHKGLES